MAIYLKLNFKSIAIAQKNQHVFKVLIYTPIYIMHKVNNI